MQSEYTREKVCVDVIENVDHNSNSKAIVEKSEHEGKVIRNDNNNNNTYVNGYHEEEDNNNNNNYKSEVSINITSSNNNFHDSVSNNNDTHSTTVSERVSKSDRTNTQRRPSTGSRWHKDKTKVKSKTSASARVHARPFYNIAGVNISALIHDGTNSSNAGNDNTKMLKSGNLIYHRKMRRLRRRCSIMEDHPLFISHRQLRETWENECLNRSASSSASAVSSAPFPSSTSASMSFPLSKQNAENQQANKLHKRKTECQRQQRITPSTSSSSLSASNTLLTTHALQSRQRYHQWRHLRNAFTAAPFASSEDVLHSLTEWHDSPSLVYAELLWNYAPLAAKELLAFNINKTDDKNEKLRHAKPVTSEESQTHDVLTTDLSSKLIKKEKSDE